MFIIVRNDEEVLAQLEPGAILTWIGLGVSEATEHRYAVQFETMNGAERCAQLNGATVHTIGDWDHATERHREVSRGGLGCAGGTGRLPVFARDAGTRRSSPSFAIDACGSGPARTVPPEAAPRRDSRRAGRDPYLNPFRVIVNKFAT